MKEGTLEYCIVRLAEDRTYSDMPAVLGVDCVAYLNI